MLHLKATLIVLFLLVGIPVHAQVPSAASLTDPSQFLSIQLLPKTPAPHQEVSARVEYPLTDLKKADISWYINGELKAHGVGVSTVKFETGAPGSVSRVKVLVNTFEGQSVQTEIVLRPADISIVWNANTYTPPFYKGKALFTNQSDLLITAVANFVNSAGTKINPLSLNYTWYRGDTLLVNESGIGKNSFVLPHKTISRDVEIKVEVSSLDGSIQASKQSVIKEGIPKVLLYEKNPLLGLLLNHSLTSFQMEDTEMTLSAIPYFFSVPERDIAALEYTWTQNNTKINLPKQESSLILRQTETDLSGKVNVGVKVVNKENYIQTGNTNVTIEIAKK